MKIIFAQGNPGTQYQGTRHNVGFFLLDEFAKQQGTAFAVKPKFIADIAELSIEGEKVLLVKPSTFYNETGQSARAITDFYKCDPASDVLVVHDDLALPLGTIRVREKGSDAGNNGIKSLNAHLGQDYHRLRIGIFNDLRNKMDDVDFVLGKFTADEHKIIAEKIAPKVETLILDFIRSQLAATTHVEIE